MKTVNAFIGSPIERLEDLRFLRGRGQYVDDVTREGLSGNLCRCTGYAHIVAAIRAAKEGER